MKIKNSKNGITLIALVITIIVLLILAGVTIAAVLGDNGIINRAEEAKNTMEQAQKNEMEQIESLTNSLNDVFGNNENNNTVTPPDPTVDNIPPTVTVNKGTITTSAITVSVTSKDDQSGMPSNPIYNYYIKKTADNDYTAASYTGTETSWTFTGLTQNTSYDVKVTTKDNAGNLGTGTATNIKTTTVEGAGDGEGNIGVTGNITAGPVSWNASTHKASVTLSTRTNLTIQYRVGSSGTWTPTNVSTSTAGKPITVSGLKHNDIVYARLIDTAGNYGDEAHLTILDGIRPVVTVNKEATTTSTVQVSVTSTDDQSGMPSTPRYNYYIKRSTEGNYLSSPTHTGTETSYTFTGLKQNTNYDVKVTTVDNANNMGTGMVTAIKTTPVEGTTPGLTTGSITAGTATWNKSTHKASVVLRTTTNKTIQYKIGAGGTYTPTSGSPATAGQSVTVTNLNHNDLVYARLVDEAGNYGSEAFITILDGTVPATPSINLSATNIKAGERLTATVTHTDDQSGVNTANSKYIWNTTSGTLGTTNASWNSASSFASNPQTITLNTANTGTYYLHVLTTDKAGNKSENVSRAVIIATPLFTTDEVANSSNKNDFYGKIVTNYTCENSSAVANWKIYYAGSDFSADGKNHIYLIADDYISYANIPKTSTGNYALTQGNYPQSAYWNSNTLNAYLGSESVANTNAEKLNNDYFRKSYISTYNNWKATAFTLDIVAWSRYKGTKADYAVGGPSIEMLMKSYSQKHNVDYRAKVINTSGYQISKNGGASWANDYSELLNINDPLYVSASKSNANAYWLASPSAFNANNLMSVNYNGNVNSMSYNSSDLGFRPLVCLSSYVELERMPDGNYKIVEKINADEIANTNDKSQYYGKEVTGYELPRRTTTDVKWKIFYAGSDFSADGKNHIYLVADKYVERQNLPNSTTAEGTPTGNRPNDGDSKYARAVYFTNILNDYAGSARITDAKLQTLNNDYFTKKYTSTNNNMKSVAYMMDTNAWNSKFKDENKAEYVMGGPTIELLFKSYNGRYKTAYESQASSATGYQIRKTSSAAWTNYVFDMLSTSDSLYVIKEQTDALAYWLASPSAYDTNSIMFVYCNGNVSGNYYYFSNLGFRPLVCLKSDIQLQKNEDGTYTIL